MSKLKVLTTPMRVRDLSFDEFEDEDDVLELKSKRLDIQKWRKFKHEMA